MRTKKTILILLLILSIGFASVSTTLVLNGNVNIGSSIENFERDIIFTRADTEKENTSIISEDGKSITFTTKELSVVNDESMLDFDITNKSRDYDAVARIDCNQTTEGFSEYLSIVPNKQEYEIAASSKTNGTMRIKLIKSYAKESAEVAFTCTLVTNASEREGQVTTKKEESAVDKLISLAEGNSNMLAYDNTSDNNLRYIGSNPNNYVSFNGEKWRIIGVMNNVFDSEGNKSSRIKIIRDSVGEYAWDNKSKGVGSSIDSWGSNEWSDSSLMEVLNNGAYWNKTNGVCPSGINGATEECDFTTTGLTNEAKSMLEKVTWNLGGTKTYTTASDGLASHFYTYERGSEGYASENLASPRTATWNGYIGLMYPSDYGFAVGGSARDKCLAKEIYGWSDENYADCKNELWLNDANFTQWTLTRHSDYSMSVFTIINTGYLYYSGYLTKKVFSVRPVAYLSNSVQIIGGTGEEKSPYILK